MFDSYILQTASSFIRRVVQIYQCSYVHALLSDFSDSVKSIKKSSILYGYILKEERISALWQESAVCKALQKFIDVFLNLFGQAYKWLKENDIKSINGRIYFSFIKPLKDAGSLISAVSAVLAGFVIMNMISVCISNSFTLFGLLSRLIVLILLLVLACVGHNKLQNAVHESKVIRLIQWLISD